MLPDNTEACVHHREAANRAGITSSKGKPTGSDFSEPRRFTEYESTERGSWHVEVRLQWYFPAKHV